MRSRELTARGRIDPEVASARLELDRIGHHTWRVSVHLASQPATTTATFADPT